MMTIEDQMLIDRLKKAVIKLESDFEAGVVSEREYQEKCKLVEEAEDKIKSISRANR